MASNGGGGAVGLARKLQGRHPRARHLRDKTIGADGASGAMAPSRPGSGARPSHGDSMGPPSARSQGNGTSRRDATGGNTDRPSTNTLPVEQLATMATMATMATLATMATMSTTVTIATAARARPMGLVATTMWTPPKHRKLTRTPQWAAASAKMATNSTSTLCSAVATKWNAQRKLGGRR